MGRRFGGIKGVDAFGKVRPISSSLLSPLPRRGRGELMRRETADDGGCQDQDGLWWRACVSPPVSETE